MASRQAITRVQAIVVILVVVMLTVAGIWYYIQLVSETNPATFSMEVVPRPFIPMTGEKMIPISIPGQKVVFLVVVEDTREGSGYGKAVDISATASDAEVLVNNPAIKSGEVAEVIVIPDQTSINKNLTITINGDRGGLKQTKMFDIEVREGEDELGEVAAEMRDKFVPWLTTNHPEFGITSETEWIGTIVNPGIWEVMHYIFFSEDWEMYVTWHIMVPPYDWIKIYLRPRFTEIRSTIAFEISSIQGGEEPHSLELPNWV